MNKYRTVFDSDEAAVDYAVLILKDLFNWGHCANRVSEQTIQQILKNHGLSKGVMREARKRMRVQILYENGTKYWEVQADA